jgi:uncharacterized membrane protein
MSEQSTLRDRLVADLSSTNTLVILVAIVLAVPIAGYTATRGVVFAGSFLLLASIGITVPYIYERYWSVEYRVAGAIGWTIGAGLVTTALFIGLYQLFVSNLNPTNTAIAAFLLTNVVQFGSAIAYQRIKNKST